MHHHPLPWELLVDLISNHLDPVSLASAACVCRSWNSTISSSDHIWHSLCASHFPSSQNLIRAKSGNPRQLFSLLYSSSSRRRRIGRSPLRISLRDVIFTVDVFNSVNTLLLSMSLPGEELVGENGVMRFEVGVGRDDVAVGDGERMRVTWMVVMKEWEGAFSVMEREGKGRVVEGDGVWFSEELPAGPGQYCPFLVGGGGGLVAEMGIGIREGKVRKVSLGIMSVIEWRYVSLDDGLLYLQQFLLPALTTF